MESIFKNNSWEIESGNLPEKNLDISNDQKHFFLKKTKLRYLNQVFFDEVVRIDIKVNGKITLELNDNKYDIETSNWEDKCVVIKNFNVECDKDSIKLSNAENNTLNLIIEPNTIIDKFTIIQDQNIDNCNPNN